MGHLGAAAAILALLASAGFLIWVGEKSGNPYQRLGRVVGAAALALSSLLVVGALYSCIEMRMGKAHMRDGMMMREMLPPRIGVWPDKARDGRHRVYKGQGAGMGLQRGPRGENGDAGPSE
ncbi:MAG TPA: hypothetical protein PLZ86_04185 [bacterium]|nr:hypothetical protein [bacterium]